MDASLQNNFAQRNNEAQAAFEAYAAMQRMIADNPSLADNVYFLSSIKDAQERFAYLFEGPLDAANCSPRTASCLAAAIIRISLEQRDPSRFLDWCDDVGFCSDACMKYIRGRRNKA